MSFEVSLLIAVLSLLGNAFFVGAEFGLVSARRSSIELRAVSGSRRARTTLDAMEHVSVMLAGAQLGVTLCSLILGAVGEPLLTHLLERPFEALALSPVLLHSTSFVLALGVMVYLHVVIGEMVPKNLALAGPDRTALALVPPLAYMVRVSKHVVMGLNALANHSLRLMGVTPQAEIASTFTRDEVAGFVKESQREGLIDKDEERLLSGALRFDELRAGAVALPMEEVAMLSTKSTPLQVERAAVETGYSRFPVRNAKGAFVGYIHLKDVLGLPDGLQDEPLPKDRLRPLPEITAGTSLRRTLALMQRSNTHLALVVGRGRTAQGLVTLEDVLEELVGDISDSAERRAAQLAPHQ